MKQSTADAAKTAKTFALIVAFTAVWAVPYPVTAPQIRPETMDRPAISTFAMAIVGWVHALATSIPAAKPAPRTNRPYVYVKNATS